MKAFPANLTRMILVACALLAELAHLGWEHLHGGVVAHHLLNRADLPAISNWWGLLVIPVLSWFLIGRIQQRISKHGTSFADRTRLPRSVLAGFLGSLVYAVSLALAFTMNQEVVTYLFMGLFALSLLVPAYRAEYVLGFVLGMAFTFGAVLPTIVAIVIAAFSRLAHWLFGSVWRFIQKRALRPFP